MISRHVLDVVPHGCILCLWVVRVSLFVLHQGRKGSSPMYFTGWQRRRGCADHDYCLR